MNGATPDADAKINASPMSSSIVTMGMSHHNFRCHRNARISPATPVLVVIALKKFLIAIRPSIRKIRFFTAIIIHTPLFFATNCDKNGEHGWVIARAVIPFGENAFGGYYLPITMGDDIMTIAWGKRLPFPWRKRAKAKNKPAAQTAETTGGGDEHTLWEKVAAGLQPLEAEVVKSRLESEDIPAVIRQESIGAVMGLTVGGLGTASVWVPEPLAKRAWSILQDE